MKIGRGGRLWTVTSGTADRADNVTYRKDIRPLRELQCAACAGRRCAG